MGYNQGWLTPTDMAVNAMKQTGENAGKSILQMLLIITWWGKEAHHVQATNEIKVSSYKSIIVIKLQDVY